ncbi:hypothetical protein BJV78DRAFT_1284119 [Lactifluus subvellereus]|nr:hypothetical protein BJV78DRAFT_1284119 [Lactifluus subvellereus]
MAARCSPRSSSIGLSSTPSAVAKAHQIGSLPPSTCVEHESPQHPSPPDQDFSMDILPRLPVTTAHPIGHPQSACPNYIATSPLSLPFSNDDDAVLPSSHDDYRRIPRACHGVERHRRSRMSSRGAAEHQYYAKLTRAERAMIKTASSRRVDFAEHVQQIPSSSMWTASEPALPAAVTKLRVKRAPTPTPTPIPDGRDLCLGLPSEDDDDCNTCGSWDERDASSGFEGDVELESEEVAPRDRTGAHARVCASASAKERLTIVVPGGKSEAYVTMAFERSCSLGADDGDGDHDMSYILPTTTATGSGNRDSDAEMPESDSAKTTTKTGLKIKIPTANSAFMLSLRLENLCRVSDDEDAGIFTSPESEYSLSSLSYTGSSSAGVTPNSLVYGSSLISAPGSRVARRVARRAALAPYAIDRSSAHTIKTRLLH